jgi:hypothetical protein
MRFFLTYSKLLIKVKIDIDYCTYFMYKTHIMTGRLLCNNTGLFQENGEMHVRQEMLFMYFTTLRILLCRGSDNRRLLLINDSDRLPGSPWHPTYPNGVKIKFFEKYRVCFCRINKANIS